jgi:hypothetical protein
LKTELKLLNNLNLFCFIKKKQFIGKRSLVIKMNISKHFTKLFRLNFTLNRSSQNAEQHTYSTYFGNALLYS